MTDQKYCRNCGASNPPDAKFCLNCRKAFVSGDAAAPLTAASVAPMPLGQRPQYSPSSQPQTIFGFSRKMVAIGIVALFVLLTLGCVAVAMTSPSTPTPTVQATVAATTAAKVTVKATPTPKPTAKPAPSGPTLSQAYLDFLQSGMEAKGYTWTENLKQSGGVGSSYVGSTFYDGKMTKDGISFDVSIEVCKDKATADSEFDFAVNNLQELGFSGNYNSATQWTGAMIISGQAIGASAVESATSSPYVVTTLMGSYD